MVNEVQLANQETGVKRYKCPFYGFGLVKESLMDTKGNQCALFVSRHSPCRMEISNQVPDWDECPVRKNTEGIDSVVRGMIEKYKIFPHEFRPEGAKSWNGISFKQWYEHIMYETEINPQVMLPA